MKQLSLYILIGMILLVGQTSLAQMKCSRVFSETQPQANEFAYEQSLIREFEVIKTEMNESTTLSEANNNIHSVVVMANRILDQAIDYIIQVNFMNLSPEAKQQRAEVTEVLMEQLQNTFSIGNNAMITAVKNRIDIEVAAQQAKVEAYEARRAIGFGRDQSAESFNSETVEKQPIGFRTSSKEDVSELEPMEKQPIGFGIKSEKQLDDTIKELVDYEAVEKAPMGFVPLKGPKDSEVESGPIGFIHFRSKAEPITEKNLHQIIFDIETGVFEFQKAVQ